MGGAETPENLEAPGGVTAPNGSRIQPLLPTRGPRYAPVPDGNGTIAMPQWEGGEHTYIGNVITLKLQSGETVAGKVPLKLPNGLALTYGQILALGGDFYGLPEAPICEDPSPPARFEQAFGSLGTDPAAAAEAPKILAVMQEEINAVNEAVRAGRPASSAYAELGDSLSEKWNRITGGGSPLTAWLPPGRYLKLAATNWDHFCPWAWTVYSMGHGAALKQAVAAAGQSDPALKAAGLELAYAMNAFADHYLSDMFSAGHMRTPRKQLYDTVTPRYVGSYCSRYMHDEDCAHGLQVSNEAGDRWTAFGDKRFFDSVNRKNKKICVQAIQASANDVRDAFEGRVPANPTAARYVPKFADLTGNPSNPENPAAMFIVGAKTVERRGDLSDRQSYKWTSWWFGLSTLAQLKLLPEFSADDVGPFDLSSNLLVWCSVEAGKFGLRLIGPGAQGFEELWSSGANDFQFDDADVFATGDLDGDGVVELVQLGVPPAALTAFTPLPNGPGYQRAAPVPLQPGSTGTPNNLLIGDIDGDGVDEFCVTCARSDLRMGLMVGRLKGGAVQMIFDQEVPAPSAYLSIAIGDLDGNGADEIVALWNDQGNQVYAGVFRWDPESASIALTRTGPLGQWTPGSSTFLCGDIDGDGRAEFLRCTDWTETARPGQIEVYEADGKGGLARSWASGPLKANLWWLADVDGDGKSELLALYAGRWATPRGGIWRDNGDGGLEEGPTGDFSNRFPGALATVDLGANFGAECAFFAWGGEKSFDTLILFGWNKQALTPVGQWPLKSIAYPFHVFPMPLPLGVAPDLAEALAGEGE